MVTNISNLTFEAVTAELGRKEFSMHYDASDCLRKVSCEEGFEECKLLIMGKYGDVLVSVNKGAYWFDEVKVEDDVFKKNMNEYNERKQKWCDMYGCD